MFTRLRTWLQTNKIFFVVSSWILLGGAAVVVSYASLKVSRTQAIVAIVQVSPQLHVTERYVRDQTLGRFTSVDVEVTNDGYPIANYQAEAKSMYKLSRRDRTTETTAYRPVRFLFAQAVTGASQGLLSTFSQPGNSEDAARIEGEVLALNGEAKEPDGLLAELVTVIAVSYTDALGETRAQYFKLQGMGAASHVSNDEGRAWVRRHADAFRMFGDIHAVNAGVLKADLPLACRLTPGCRP
jgi:hypothetical protein